MPAAGLAALLSERRSQGVDAPILLEAERPALGPDRVVEESVQRDDDRFGPGALGLRLPFDRRRRGRPLVQPEEFACCHCS